MKTPLVKSRWGFVMFKNYRDRNFLQNGILIDIAEFGTRFVITRVEGRTEYIKSIKRTN